MRTPRTRPWTTRLASATRSPSVRYGTVDAAAGVATADSVASRHATAIRVLERKGRRRGIVEYQSFNRHFRGLASARAAGPIDGPELHVTARFYPGELTVRRAGTAGAARRRAI